MNESGETEAPARPEAYAHGPSWVLSRRFDSMHDLTTQVQGWDIDFRQIDEGPLTVDLLQVGTGRCLLSRARFNRRFHQRGVSPAGMRTFGVLESGVTDVTWGGREVDETTLIVFHPLGDFEAVAAAGFHCYVISFAERHLGLVAEHLGFEQVLRKLDGADMVTLPDLDEMADLRSVVRTFCAKVEGIRERNPASVLPADLVERLEHEIPGRILAALAGSDVDLRLPPEELRYQAARRAVEFAEDNSEEVLTVEDLLEATGVSRRTLNYAFRGHLGVTPKTYLKSMRLDAARLELEVSGPGAKIADIANRYGFWHLGQFAADYRKQFGELPSETLRRTDHNGS
jgi:AraC-like DNA-binding protein